MMHVTQLALFTLALVVLAIPSAASAQFESDNLFVSVGGGIVRQFDSDGELIGDLDTETGSAEIGDMCFDSDGSMFTMNFQAQSISKFTPGGGLAESSWATSVSRPESCVFDRDSNLYVGTVNVADDGGVLEKRGPDGSLLDTFEPELDLSGIDQIDLAQDQCTLLYNSEGGNILAFDVCSGDQLPAFAEGIGANCNNLRIRPNGEVLIACDSAVLRLDTDGEVIQTYEPSDAASGGGGLFALNLDPDNEHFFTATYTAGLVWRIDIESGDGVEEPYIQTTIEGDSIGGLALYGELTVAAPEPPARIAGDRPSVVRALPDPTDISTDPAVVGTNLLLATIAVLVIFLSAQVFNSTIQDNNREIERMLKPYTTPVSGIFRGIGKAFSNFFPSTPGKASNAGVIAILLVTALVYGFLEPGFGFNTAGVALFVSLAAGLGVITYVYNGTQARVSESRFKALAGVRIFPVALAIAAFSVAISRATSFEPGIVYGFVAAAAVTAPIALNTKQEGEGIFFAATALLATFAVAWSALIPAREWANSDDNIVAVTLEATAALIAVSALGSLVFSMIPIDFMDGRKLFAFNRIAWFAVAIVVALLYWHVVLVQDDAGFEAVGRRGTIAALIALGVCVCLTAAAWFYFRRTAQSAGADPSDAAGALPNAGTNSEPGDEETSAEP